MKPLYILYACVSLGVASVVVANEEGAEATEIVPIPRPVRPAFALQSTIQKEYEEGFSTTILYLRSPTFELEAAPPPQNWELTEKTNTSLAFKFIANDKTELTYSFYPKDKFIESLEPDQIMGYVESLKKIFGEPDNSSITLLNEAQAYAPQKPVVKIKRPDGTYFEHKRTLGRYPLGQQYKIIEYEVTSVDNNAETTSRYMDYILIFKDYTFFAQFKAPPEIFAKLRSSVDLFIRTTQNNA